MNKLSVKDQNRVQIEYSFQDARTDSIALLENKSILRDSDGKIIFRKSGHGALIENIRRFKADLIFIKTVDSIKPNDMESVDSEEINGQLFSVTSTQIDPIFDLNVGLEYRLSEQISGFLNMHNLVVQRYQRWNNYPVQRFNIMGGITYSFWKE